VPYWRLFYHITWSVKDRLPLIEPEWKARLYAALSAKARDLGAKVHAIGGTADHMHMALSVPPSVALSRVAGELKGSSAHFVNHELGLDHHFSWQSSFCVVSFGERSLPMVVRYIHDQEKHHDQGNTDSLFESDGDNAL